MTISKLFDYEGKTEYMMENKIGEYDKRINIIINHIIQNDDYATETRNVRNILETKRRKMIGEYTRLFLNTYPYESENPVLEARKILYLLYLSKRA
jgi:hypothetical protein